MTAEKTILGGHALRQLRVHKATLTKRHSAFGPGGLPKRFPVKPAPKITLRRADYERDKTDTEAFPR